MLFMNYCVNNMLNRKCERQTESSYAFPPRFSFLFEEKTNYLTWSLVLNPECLYSGMKKHKPIVTFSLFSYRLKPSSPLQSHWVAAGYRTRWWQSEETCVRWRWPSLPEDILSKEVICKEVQLSEDCLTFEHMFTLLLFGTETTREIVC